MRICAIDYGDARTGLAVSDPTGLLAGFTTTIHAYRPELAAEQIDVIAKERGAEKLVVGHPVNMDGTRGPRAEKSEAFAELLRGVTGLPVELWDERLTTVNANRILQSSGKSAKRRKEMVDAVAASLILEGYLLWEREQASRQNGETPERPDGEALERPNDGQASNSDGGQASGEA